MIDFVVVSSDQAKTLLLDTSGLLGRQQTGTRRPEGLQLQWSQKQTWVWEEYGEAVEKDFQLAPRKFWQTDDSRRESRAWLRMCSAGEENC